MIFVVSFCVYVAIGIFGYVGWGDPINWPFLISVAFVAALFTSVTDPMRKAR
jgi:type IV secretory pathway VirB2 component (pilin)